MRNGLDGLADDEDNEREPGLQAFSVDSRPEAGCDGDPPASVHAAMTRLGESPAFLDLDRASRDPRLREWLDQNHRLRSIGATYSPEADADEYVRATDVAAEVDGLLWVAETSRAVPVDEE